MKVVRRSLVGLLAAIAMATATGPGAGGQAARLAVAPAPGSTVPVIHVAGNAQLPSSPVLAAAFDDLSLRKTDKIAPVLDKLYRVDALSRAMAHRPVTAAVAATLPDDLGGLVSAGHMRIDDAARVQVWAHASADPSSAASDLAALGMDVQLVDNERRIVQGAVPISQLASAAALPSVSAIRLPEYGVTDTGSVETQGDAILNAQALRSTFGVDGTGVRVGVISDGMQGLASSQSTGDLGPVDLTTCNQSPGATSPTASGAGAEGTAMSEIVHDLAPGAQIFFGYFGMNTGGTALNFNNAVNCLAAHTDVVVDDIGWFNTGPNDGTSYVSANTSSALNNTSNPIRGYYTAVANQARNHYHAAYADSGVHTPSITSGDWWELQQFQGGGGTTDGGSGLRCSSTSAAYCGDTVEVAPGGSFSVFLQWNDPYGSSANDYDLLVQDNSISPATISPQNPQRQGVGFPYPVESFTLSNTHGVNTVYNILIGNYKGLAAPRTFDMFVICQNCFAFPTGLPAPDDIALHNYNTLAGSVPNQSDSGGGVVSVGAISAADSPNYDTIDGYSGRGPTADGRTKPDATGIDCVSITGAAGFPNPFCGTSAAAPHAAGIAALLLSCNPALLAGSGSGTPASNRSTLANALLGTSIDLGVAGVDNTYGHGRLDALAAAYAAGCVPPTPTNTPTPTATATATPTATATIDPALDTDGDGCPDVKELGPSHNFGGQRDPNDPWDFYDVPVPALKVDPTGTRDQGIGVTSDVVALLQYVGETSASPDYTADKDGNGVEDGLQYDRSPSTTPNEPWRSGPPDGGIGITTDVVAMLAQVGDNCAS